MKKLLLIFAITLNLNIIAADHARAGASETALSGEAEEKYLNEIFQAILDIHALAQQAQKNLAPDGLEINPEADRLKCNHSLGRTKGRLYIQSMGRPCSILYSPWGSVNCFELFSDLSLSQQNQSIMKIRIQEEVNRHLRLRLIGGLQNKKLQDNILQLHCRYMLCSNQVRMDQVKAVDGRLLPAGMILDRTPAGWQHDWDRRALQHSWQSARWSESRKAWLGTVLRGCLAREKALKPAAPVREVINRPVVRVVGKPSCWFL